MEELIKIHARQLAEIDEIIWDDMENEMACLVGIRSIRQLEAFIQCFPGIISNTLVDIWLADSVYRGTDM